MNGTNFLPYRPSRPIIKRFNTKIKNIEIWILSQRAPLSPTTCNIHQFHTQYVFFLLQAEFKTIYLEACFIFYLVLEIYFDCVFYYCSRAFRQQAHVSETNVFMFIFIKKGKFLNVKNMVWMSILDCFDRFFP